MKERRRRREAAMDEEDAEMAALIAALDKRADRRIAHLTGRPPPPPPPESAAAGSKSADPRAERAEAQVERLVERGLHVWVDDWLHDRLPSPELRRRMRQALDEVNSERQSGRREETAAVELKEEVREDEGPERKAKEAERGKDPPRPILKKKVSFSA